MVAGRVRLEDGGTYSVHVCNGDVPQNVHFLQVSSSRNFVAFNRASWLRFVAEFSQNPALKTIHFVADWIAEHIDENGNRVIGAFEENNLNVETLTQIIEALTGEDPTKIKDFSVLYKTFTGAAGPDDGWERFNRSMQVNFRALERFRISKYEGQEAQLLEPMTQTIFSLPTLLWVELKLPGLTLSPDTLQNLGRCRDLKNLDIAKTELNDEHIMTLANALQKIRSLDFLHVQISSQLEDPEACGNVMSRMLQGIPGPVTVYFHSSSDKLQDEFHLAFVDVMEAGDTFGVGTLNFDFNLSEKALNAYMNLSNERYDIAHHFWWNFEDRHSDLFQILQFNLALNRAGRAKVIAQGHWEQHMTPSREQWVDVIIRANDVDSEAVYDEAFGEEKDLISTLFYFLSQNPSLCDSANN